jgi:CubicO group peptidase (beta-lactamase class C family)
MQLFRFWNSQRVMKKLIALVFLAFTFCNQNLNAQQIYTPPLIGNQWDTMQPARLGWCEDSIASLYDFLEGNQTKGFIVLKEGKIVLEKYFETFTMDSAWYWASAGKTITSFLIGKAQEEGRLSISDPSNLYLDSGWTSLTKEQEDSITIWHHLTMTTGLNYNVQDKNCKSPSCLTYLNPAGKQWFYHNAPYLLLQDIVANATGNTFQQYTQQKLGSKIGMTGLWINGTFYSRPRSMARFGLLMLNNGIWGSDTIMKDTAYFNQMITPSQNHNKAYGYLWWLNGQDTFMVPEFTFRLPGTLISDAPSDMYCGLGKNDQKVYVSPSQNLVVVRMGEDTGDNLFGPSSFDNKLWRKIQNLSCSMNSSRLELVNQHIRVLPNPGQGVFQIKTIQPVAYCNVYNMKGELVLRTNTIIDITNQATGIYWVNIVFEDGTHAHEKFIFER